MDPVQVLRERERLFAIRYGADRPPRVPDGDTDLRSEDVEDAEHWMRVYGELVEFLHGLGGSGSETPRAGQDRVGILRAMRLEVKVYELHLAFWTDQLKRLRENSGSDEPPTR